MKKNDCKYVWPLTAFSILSCFIYGIIIFGSVVFMIIYIINAEKLKSVFFVLIVIVELLLFSTAFKFIIIKADGIYFVGMTKYGFILKIKYNEVKKVKIRLRQEDGEHACTILGNETDTLIIETIHTTFLYPIRMYNKTQREKILEKINNMN